MFHYEKRLQYPVNIRKTDAQMAKAIITQFGGPDGEAGASLRYLSQRFAMPYREVMGVLTDIGTSVTRSFSSLAFSSVRAIIQLSPVLGGVRFVLYRRCLGSHVRFSRRNTLRLVYADMVHR